ncbi:MAG: hypothetical protein QNK89_07790, partial [Lacinutrix sp.]|uniref:hypothetical protein n=1 Tax=Lacinutrix sp. TaxID=1937692 RepID=UPI0030A675B3
WQLEKPLANIEKADHKYGMLFEGINAFYDISKEDRYKNELLNIYQYEEEVESEALSLENLIWHFNLGDDRTVLSRLNALGTEDLEKINAEIKVVTLSKLLTLINEDDNIEKKKLNQLYLKHADQVLKEKREYKDFSQIYTNALSVYTIAKGINDGIIIIDHKEKTIKSWQLLTKHLLDKKYRNSEWNIGITGALLLASNEIYNLLD